MAEPYGWRMTPDGLALIAAALSSNAPIGIATIVLGDGGGTTPPVTATGIVHEVWRGPVSALRRSPDNRLVVEIQTIVPVSAGPFVIREAAILASDGTVIALCRRQDLYKGGPSESHAIDVLAQIVVAEAAVVEMAVDTGTYATLRTVQVAVDEGLAAHAASRNHPAATEVAQGMVRFATKAETIAGVLTSAAVNPAGVKAVVDALVDGAPDALNTLRELAQAVANDQSFASSMLAALAAKAPLASPAFTGTPTVPTAAAGTATTQAASTAFVGNALATFGGFVKTTTGASLEAPQNSYSGDLNTIEVGGVFTAGINGATNAPTGWTLGMLSQFAEVPGWDVGKQLIASPDGTVLKMRVKWGGGRGAGWTAWNTIWSSANDGTGSGLDADLLDGLHASDLKYAIQRVYAENREYIIGTATIPHDDTIPQITEGLEVLSATITPTSAASKLRISAVVNMCGANATSYVSAVFRSDTSNAIAIGQSNSNGSSRGLIQTVVDFIVPSGTTAPLTISVRVGNSGAWFYINGDSGNSTTEPRRFFGGSSACTLIVEELKG